MVVMGTDSTVVEDGLRNVTGGLVTIHRNDCNEFKEEMSSSVSLAEINV